MSRSLSDVREDMAKTLAKTSEVRQAVNTALVEFKDSITQTTGKLENISDTLKNVNAKAAKRRKDINDKQSKETQELNDKFQAEVQAITENHERELQKLMDKYKRESKHITDKFKRDLNAVNSQSKKDLEAIDADLAERTAELEKEREKAVEEGRERAIRCVEGCEEAQMMVRTMLDKQGIDVEDFRLIVMAFEEQQRQSEQQGLVEVPEESPVVLDIGGQTFKTTRGVLERAGKGTFFYRMLRGEQQGVQRQKDGSFFIDRDATVFKHVLNFLRDGRLKLDRLSKRLREDIEEDAAFYEVHGLSLYLSGKTRLHLVRGGNGGNGKEFEVETANLKQQFPQPPTQQQIQQSVQPPLGDTFFVRMLDGRVAVKRNARHAFVIDRDADLFEEFVLPIIINGTSHQQQQLPLESSLSAGEVSALEDEEKGYGMMLMSRFPQPPENKIKSGPNYTLDATGTIATKTSADGPNANCLGSIRIPNTGTWKWRVTLKKSAVSAFAIGAAPASLDQNGTDVYMKCGWYLSCYSGKLYSGPPTSYNDKSYATGVSQMKAGEYVDVIVDRGARTISFSVNGVDKGVAYKDVFGATDDIRPCVLIYRKNDSFQIGPMESC